MIPITDSTKVADLARSYPASTRVFEQYGIDFCCGGDKPLAEACREKGVPLESLLASVENAQAAPGGSPSSDWGASALTPLIDHILAKHHAYLKAELPRLAAMLAKVIEVHGQKHGESLHPISKLYTGLQRELEDHMWKEENILFPLIKRLEQPAGARDAGGPAMSVANPIRVMEFEHVSAGNALGEMRRISSNFQAPEDGCATYRAVYDGFKTLEADLHEHIHLENNILFPRAIALEH